MAPREKLAKFAGRGWK